MGKINVTTNIPSLIVQVFDSENKMVEQQASSKPIPYFNNSGTDILVKNNEGEEVETISVDNLKNGIYCVRLCLPYFNGINRNEPGSFFPMPVMMDRHYIVHDEKLPLVEITFKANLI